MRISRPKEYSFPALFVFLLSVLLLSCSNNDLLPQEEDITGTIILSIKSSNFQSRNGEADDEITKLRVLVFDDSDELEFNGVFDEDLSGSNSKVHIPGLKTGEKSLFIIANEIGNEDLGGLNIGDRLSEVRSKILTVGESGAGAYVSFMTGKRENVELVKGVNNESVTLRRVVAKITLRLKNFTDKNVTVSKIKLLNNTQKTWLWENTANIAGQEYLDNDVWTSEIELSDEEQEIVSVYVFENLGNSDSSKDNATQLVVEGSYDGLPVTYHAFVNSDSNDNPFNISRNSEYRISGNVKAAGEMRAVTLNIDDYNIVQPQGKDSEE